MQMIIALSLIPLVLFFAIIFFVRKGVLLAALISLIATVLISFLVWQVDIARVAVAGAQGLFIAAEIILIIFGALLMLGALEKKNSLPFLKSLFDSVSSDKRVHVILIGWGLIYFLEGVAGFGTPAVIAIPLFLALGFAPLTAVVLSLIGDSVPVIFGAIGLPVTYGLLAPLAGFGVDATFGEGLLMVIAALNFIGSAIIPVALLFVFSRIEKKPFSHFMEFVPFALMAGFVTSLAAFATAYFIGPELPSVVGGIVAIACISLMAKYHILTPRTEAVEMIPPVEHLKNRRANTIRSLSPYAILLVLLIVSRLPFLPFREWLTSTFAVQTPSLLGFTLNYSFYPLYSAGTFMLVAALAAFLILKLTAKEIAEVIVEGAKKIMLPFTTLVLILAFVQVFIASGDNASGLPSMLFVLARAAGETFGPVWPLVAPAIGALGSFAAGSATVSNIIFSGFHYQTALGVGFNPILILSLQGVGAAAGNMIALHNVIAALTIAGLVGKERNVIRQNLPVLLIYLLIIGLVGLVLAR